MMLDGRKAVAAAAVVLALAVVTVVAFALESGERVALVVGNGQYQHVPTLRNPSHDAGDMAAKLERLGFSVTRIADAGKQTLERALQRFRNRASRAEVAVVFYAGHGIEVDQRNFLVPVDAQLASDGDVEYEAVPLELVTGAVSGADQFSLVFLDACRDNPFVREMRRSGATRSIGRGLGRVEPTGGMVVAYAAQAGTTADDGDGRNSPYTTALLRHLDEPGLDVGMLLRKVGASVRRATGGQEPVYYGHLPDRPVYLASGPALSGPGSMGGVSAPGDPDPAAEMWKVVRDSGDPALVRDFLTRHPNSAYTGAARALLRRLSVQPFTVETVPASARVRLLDSDQQYRAGMDLPAGEYRVEVRADGYETAVQTVRHRSASATRHRIALERAAPQWSPGERFRDCPSCPEMVVIPSGRFRMGCVSGLDCEDDEMPVHEVTIPAAFALGRHEVTFAEWDACVSGGGCGGHRPNDAGWGRGSRPVMNVSWDDAKEYVAWLSSRTGAEYRLPSESEWEYAARAGTATKYGWGNDIGANRANCLGDHCGDQWEYTAPAGSFAPNGFGLFDMHGNVVEWVEDCSNGSYAGAPTDGSAWVRGDCAVRVLRGGSWFNFPWDLRAADRGRIATGDRYGNYGFRVARTLAP